MARKKDAAPAPKSTRGHKKAAREQALAALRLGPAGVTAWNQGTLADHKALGDLKKIDLAHCQLAGIEFADLNLAESNFAGANLARAELQRTNLRKANLAGANLDESNAYAVKLMEANLEAATLRKASLLGAKLFGATLRGADLTGADLQRADLTGADLTGAILTGAELRYAEYDATTQFPAGFDPRDAAMNYTGTMPLPVPEGVVPETLDFATFYERLKMTVDAGRLSQAIAMLRGTKFHLFAEVNDTQVIGVTRSQGSADRFYACRLTSTGQYECGTQRLNKCAAQGRAVCKHLLVLIVGLTRGGAFDCGTAYQWLRLSRGQAPTMDREAMTATFLKYKGVEAGEVDWRPTETVPEDYYAL